MKSPLRAESAFPPHHTQEPALTAPSRDSPKNIFLTFWPLCAMRMSIPRPWHIPNRAVVSVESSTCACHWICKSFGIEPVIAILSLLPLLWDNITNPRSNVCSSFVASRQFARVGHMPAKPLNHTRGHLCYFYVALFFSLIPNLFAD
jgi:hypothetical protein